MNDEINSIPLTNVTFDYTQQLDDLVMYVEMIAGGVIELIWIAKTFLIMYIILSAWRLVRK